MAKNCVQISIRKCNFKVQDDKLGTGRVVVWNEFGVTNSFTFENSFFGYRKSENEIIEYTADDYIFIG